MATRVGRKWCDPCALPQGVTGAAAPFLSILVNNIQVYGAAVEGTPPAFIVRTLVDRGAIVYDRISGLWSAFNSVGGRDRFNFPKRICLIGDGGRLSDPIEVDVNLCIFTANAYWYKPADEVKRKVETLSMLSNSTAQNLNSLKESAAIIYTDSDLTENIDKAERDRLEGKPTVKIYNKSGMPINIERFGTGAPSHLMDYLELWKNTMEELDQLTGRASVGEKTERRINSEMAVIENAALSSIDVMIDSINNYADYYGVDIKAERGHSIVYSPITADNTGTGENTPPPADKPQDGTGGA